MRSVLIILFLTFSATAFSQKHTYVDSMRLYQKEYADTHEVVKGLDKKHLRFFPIQQKYRVPARFERITDSVGFNMPTSGKISKHFFRYGILKFRLDNKDLQLTVYQNEKLMATDAYKDYLFIPFTDLTSGDKSYGGGRYIDILISDISNNALLLDFNKAYNPYCAYTTGYNCPIPPRENDLPVAIKAGEMEFGKAHN
ncbi:MAG: DUF1684 domain-containing protein [Ferruginibacter sp.]